MDSDTSSVTSSDTESTSGDRVIEMWNQSLISDFTSLCGAPAVWVPGHPQHWGQERAKIQINENVKTPALSHDDVLIAVGVRNEIHIYHLATQQRVEVLQGHKSKVQTVVFAGAQVQNEQNESRYLLVSQSQEKHDTGIIMTWDLDRHGKRVLSHDQKDKSRFPGELGSHGNPIFSPDNKIMIYVIQNGMLTDPDGMSEYNPSVILWDIESRSLRHELLGHTDCVLWIGICPNSQLAASISWDGTARIWDMNSAACIRILGPFGGQLWSGVFSPDGKYLAISQGSPECSVHVHDVATGQLISRNEDLPDLWTRSLAWSPDGSLLAGGSENGHVRLWDPNTGAEKMRWCPSFAGYTKMTMNYSSAGGLQFVGQKLIFRIGEGTVGIYDVERNLKRQFSRLAEDPMHQCSRGYMICSNDEKVMVVPDADGVLRLWDL
ncbi:hypothetical protein N7513_013126 [Penicillium frequentans]|nr:hypothetical protein N7513_013126 [Penicillium glabrum]